jgi:D-alanine-D-alanine ligase-like ATP-grasp enzyme/ribosomal protein S18 acetylase RimI-like enzyme
MTATDRGVLILYNDPAPPAGEGPSRWEESETGVLAEALAVAEVLAGLGIPSRRAGIRRLADLPGALAGGPERIVFNLVEGLPAGPRDANAVPAVCRALGRVCTGNEAVSMDKWLTKAALSAHGVPTPAGVVVPVGARPAPADLPPGRLIVKPIRADGSEGIDAASVVPGPGQALLKAIGRIHRDFDQPALVEQFIDGREINVSVIQRAGALRVLPLAEIDFSAFGPDRPRIVDYAAKWRQESFEFRNTPRKIPASLPAKVAAEIRRHARAAWHAVACQDYARVDCRVDAQGRAYVIEVNANPDISPDAGFRAALSAGKIPFDQFVLAMLRNAEARLGASSATGLAEPATVSPAGEGQTEIRWSRQTDRQPVLDLLAGTGVFRPGELDIAREVLDDALRDGPAGHYQSYTAELDGRAVGWVCFGPTPCTEGTFDMYWLAVDLRLQKRGIGRALMLRAEGQIVRRGGRLIVLETSGRADYDLTRKFYLHLGYHEASCVPDFYAPDDAKVTYTKRLV